MFYSVDYYSMNYRSSSRGSTVSPPCSESPSQTNTLAPRGTILTAATPPDSPLMAAARLRVPANREKSPSHSPLMAAKFRSHNSPPRSPQMTPRFRGQQNGVKSPPRSPVMSARTRFFSNGSVTSVQTSNFSQQTTSAQRNFVSSSPPRSPSFRRFSESIQEKV